MSYHWSLISIIFIQFLCIYSTPLTSEATNHLMEVNDEDYQRAHTLFLYFIKNILDASNPNERISLLNQLREYLNRMCIVGYFGPSHADACQRVVDIIHQTYINNHFNDEETNDTSNESHGIQKTFFFVMVLLVVKVHLVDSQLLETKVEKNHFNVREDAL